MNSNDLQDKEKQMYNTEQSESSKNASDKEKKEMNHLNIAERNNNIETDEYFMKLAFEEVVLSS